MSLPGSSRRVLLQNLQPDTRYSVLVTAEYRSREGGSASAQGKTSETHTHTHIKYSIFSVYWPSMYFALHTALPDSVLSPMCFSAQPASLRVSSVSVVRSDHSSICVSWRPVPAVSVYRVVIQALRGTSSEMNHHNASWTFFLCVEN